VSLPIRTTPEAVAQIREIDSWWRENRPGSPDLFVEELAESFEIISSAPFAGRRYRNSVLMGTHRILLKGTRFHVYYLPRDDEVIVLAVWHARRGAGPPLRQS
jgi:plasmid stabilization system protein ParE